MYQRELMGICYLYLLVGAGKHAGFFKIGMSADPYIRQNQLSQEFNLDKSMCIGFDRDTARAYEALLHRRLKDHLIDRHCIGDSHGNTEWFSMAAFDEAIAQIQYTEAIKDQRSLTGLIKIVRNLQRVNINIPKKLHKQIKQIALDRDTSIQAVIEQLLAETYSNAEF